jgi:hypothetical protein
VAQRNAGSSPVAYPNLLEIDMTRRELFSKARDGALAAAFGGLFALSAPKLKSKPQAIATKVFRFHEHEDSLGVSRLKCFQGEISHVVTNPYFTSPFAWSLVYDDDLGGWIEQIHPVS